MNEQQTVSPHEIKKFKRELITRAKESGSLIPLLQSAQDSYGYVPEMAIHYISELVNIPASDIYGVVTFYTQFRLAPLGRHLIKICEGTACHVNGAKKILKMLNNELGITTGETDPEGLFTLQSVACLGCCSLSPVMMIGSETYGSLTPDKVKTIIDRYRKRERTNERS